MMHHIHPLLSLTDGPELLLMRQYVPAHGSALRESIYACYALQILEVAFHQTVAGKDTVVLLLVVWRS